MRRPEIFPACSTTEEFLGPAVETPIPASWTDNVRSHLEHHCPTSASLRGSNRDSKGPLERASARSLYPTRRRIRSPDDRGLPPRPKTPELQRRRRFREHSPA